MKKIMLLTAFSSLFLWACNTQVETQKLDNQTLGTQKLDNKSTEDLVAAKNVKTLTIVELHNQVKENRDEINQLGKQIDDLLKGI